MTQKPQFGGEKCPQIKEEQTCKDRECPGVQKLIAFMSKRTFLPITTYFFLDTQTWTGQCVQDSSKRLLPKSVSVSSNSPVNCMKACKGAGYKFAGVQFSSQCFCGQSPPPASTIKPSGECNRVCPGNTGQKCGGSWRMNVYAIGKNKTKSTCHILSQVHPLHLKGSTVESANGGLGAPAPNHAARADERGAGE